MEKHLISLGHLELTCEIHEDNLEKHIGKLNLEVTQ